MLAPASRSIGRVIDKAATFCSRPLRGIKTIGYSVAEAVFTVSETRNADLEGDRVADIPEPATQIRTWASRWSAQLVMHCVAHMI
jgi:hypothetical protein